MNITLDKQSPTDARIEISLSPADYEQKVEKALRDFSRKAVIKGFRQGKVPTGVVKKMYGNTFLLEEINRILSDALEKYIVEQKLPIVGQPLPIEKENDWENDREFRFSFEIGLAPPFELPPMTAAVKFDQYRIETGKKEIDSTVKSMRERFGERTKPEISASGDILMGDIQAQGSEEKKASYLPLQRLKGNAEAPFLGLKIGDSVTLDIEKLTDDLQLRSWVLNSTEEEAAPAKGQYVFTITEINRVTPAELNQKLFDQVFGKDSVTSEDLFEEKVKETIAKNYARETEHFLEHEIEQYLLDKTSIALPEAFLKKWLKERDKNITDEVLEREFVGYAQGLKWNLIESKIAEDNTLEVSEEEVKQKAKEGLMAQFSQFSANEEMETWLNSYVIDFLRGKDGKGENYERLYRQIRKEKIITFVKEKITLREVNITADEFQKKAAPHRH